MSTVKLSGNARVLRVLRLGPTHQGEWFNPADGQNPITRLSARIWDLQHKSGHEIEAYTVDGLAFEMYRLVREAAGCRYAFELDKSAGVTGSDTGVRDVTVPERNEAVEASCTPTLLPARSTHTAIDDDYDWDEAA